MSYKYSGFRDYKTPTKCNSVTLNIDYSKGEFENFIQEQLTSIQEQSKKFTRELNKQVLNDLFVDVEREKNTMRNNIQVVMELREEFLELSEKIARLEFAINTMQKEFGYETISLMREQLVSMKQYAVKLIQRAEVLKREGM